MSAGLFDLHGRVAIVTGAAGGLDAAAAAGLAAFGADVALARPLAEAGYDGLISVGVYRSRLDRPECMQRSREALAAAARA